MERISPSSTHTQVDPFDGAERIRNVGVSSETGSSVGGHGIDLPASLGAWVTSVAL